MAKKKLLAVTIGLGLLFFGNTMQVSAAAKGNPNDLKIDAKANEDAVKFVEERSGLENSPVPVENLTTQQPHHLSSSSSMMRKSRKFYRVDGAINLPASLGGGGQWRSNYLVPVGFNWNDNGIPASVWNYSSVSLGEHFVFHNVADTGKGGYGTGGYYWRYFSSRARNGVVLYFWLSAWNLDHLIYG